MENYNEDSERGCFACSYSLDPPYPLFDGKFWKLYLAEDQSYVGRSYLNLKVHKSSLSEIDFDEWREYIEIVRKVEMCYRQVFDAEVINWSLLMNNAFIEGSTPHVHWHIRPRHSKPVYVGDNEFVDKLFGYHYDDNLKRNVSDTTKKQIAQIIRQNIVAQN